MKPIEINFAGDKHLYARWIIACALLLLVVVVAMHLKSRGEKLDADRATLYATAELLPDDAPGPEATRMQLPAGAITALETPWDTLINALEMANGTGIRITSITPEPATGTITVDGEAENFDALRNYLVSLGKAGMRDTVLISESMSELNSRINFQIAASWPDARPGAVSP